VGALALSPPVDEATSPGWGCLGAGAPSAAAPGLAHWLGDRPHQAGGGIMPHYL
jgi:hypothetical protein